MKSWKRAKLFLIRNRNRTLTLFCLLTVIATLVLTGLSAGNAISLAQRELRRSIGGYFTIKRNEEQGSQMFVGDVFIREVNELDGIKAWNGLDMAYMYVEDMDLLPGRFTMEGDGKAKMTQVLGNTDSGRNEYFVLQMFEITQGRHISPKDKNKALLSETLALMNGLTVGDTFLICPNTEGMEQSGKVESGSLEIVGLYRTEGSQKGGDRAECDIQENFIFTDTSFVRQMQSQVVERQIQEYSVGASFFVEDAGELDGIVQKVQKLSGYDGEGYVITKNNKTYDDMAVPLNRMSGLLRISVLGILAVSAVILSLILLMWMRDRTHENGVLLSMGISRREIFGQHVMENTFVAFAAFLLSAGIVSILSEWLGKFFMDVDIRVGKIELLEIFGAGYLVVLISIGVASVRVFRMQPKDILSEID